MTPGQRRADALARLAEAALAGDLDGGTAGDRYQVMLHVEVAGRAADCGSEPDPHAPPADGAWREPLDAASMPAQVLGAVPVAFEAAVIECGDRAVDVSAETYARLACDAAVVVMQHDAAGNVLNVGRKTRSVPPAIRRALEARDTGCRFPGCTARRCDAHHVVHWGDGGPTSLDNLMLLCRHHHRLLHEGGYSVIPGAGGTFWFVSAKGRQIEAVPAAPAWLLSRSGGTAGWLHALPGDEVGRPVTPATWDGSQFNLIYVIDVLRRGEPMLPG